MPSAVCDGPACSVCNRETECRSGDSGLDNGNDCSSEYATKKPEFQVSTDQEASSRRWRSVMFGRVRVAAGSAEGCGWSGGPLTSARWTVRVLCWRSSAALIRHDQRVWSARMLAACSRTGPGGLQGSGVYFCRAVRGQSGAGSVRTHMQRAAPWPPSNLI